MLSSSTAAQPTFTAPPTTMGDDLTFSLTVSDGDLTSSPDTVTIGVRPHTIWLITDATEGELAPIRISTIAA